MIHKSPRFFLDSGNPDETRRALALLGHLDGQTTNPTLVLRNPEVASYVQGGKTLTESELLSIYRQIIEKIAAVLPEGHISIEVNANWDSTPSDLLAQAEKMYTWGTHVNIKFPTTNAGVSAAHEFVKQGGRVNMTLVFDQNQAAAVYSATRETTEPVFLSPFLGRWDDRGFQGAELIKNIVRMYREFDLKRAAKQHVMVLAASIRTMDHLLASIAYGADILTIPLKTIEMWVAGGKKMPDQQFNLSSPHLKVLPYQDISYTDQFESYDIKRREGDLLDEGLCKFSEDWQKILGR